MAAATLFTLTALLGFGSNPIAVLSRPSSGLHSSTKNNNCSSSLAQLALAKVLDDAGPIFGDYVDTQSDTSSWYAALYAESQTEEFADDALGCEHTRTTRPLST